MADFKYAPMFQVGKDETEYRLLTKEGVSVGDFEGHPMLKVKPEALTLLAQQQPSGSSPKQDVHNVVITRLMATTTAKLIL